MRWITITVEKKSFKSTDINELVKQFKMLIPKRLRIKNIVFVCIGTDRSTGDALGPFVGSMLEKLGYDNILGTLDNPVHAMNLKETLEKIPKDKIVIGIDACLGQHTNIGNIQFGTGPVRPGAGVNKILPPVGDYHIIGTVNVGGFMEYFVLQNTRLSLVINMAEMIVKIITSRFIPNLLHIREAASANEKLSGNRKKSTKLVKRNNAMVESKRMEPNKPKQKK